MRRCDRLDAVVPLRAWIATITLGNRQKLTTMIHGRNIEDATAEALRTIPRAVVVITHSEAPIR